MDDPRRSWGIRGVVGAGKMNVVDSSGVSPGIGTYIVAVVEVH